MKSPECFRHAWPPVGESTRAMPAPTAAALRRGSAHKGEPHGLAAPAAATLCVLKEKKKRNPCLSKKVSPTRFLSFSR